MNPEIWKKFIKTFAKVHIFWCIIFAIGLFALFAFVLTVLSPVIDPNYLVDRDPVNDAILIKLSGIMSLLLLSIAISWILLGWKKFSSDIKEGNFDGRMGFLAKTLGGLLVVINEGTQAGVDREANKVVNAGKQAYHNWASQADLNSLVAESLSLPDQEFFTIVETLEEVRHQLYDIVTLFLDIEIAGLKVHASKNLWMAKI